ncbi:MAG: HlyD family efflux transporter periplasmic adaptor subunit, partial [Clostridia bacterium]|nr:HlyD family efflux transporter periplasmic adaptor subunit [Clostridia bacterium]
MKIPQFFLKAKNAFQKKKKKTKRNIVISAIAILLIASFGINFWIKSSKSESSITYKDVKVERRDITVTLTGTGTIEPVNQYTITSLVSGEVLDAPFNEGDIIKKGSLLYSIDTSDATNNVEKAQISVEKAQQSYAETLETKKNLSVTSDVSGIIQDLKVDVGDTVSNGTEIATVVDNSTMLLKVPFNSTDAANIRVGQSAKVTLDGSFQTLTGTVSNVSNVENVLTGNMLVRTVTIKVKNPGALTTDDYATAVVGSFACNSGANFEPLSKKTITAKASGDVSKIYYDEGSRVKSGTTILKLTNSDIDTQISTAALSLQDAKLSQ